MRQEIARKLEAEHVAWRVWITETWWWATRKTPVLPPGGDRAELYLTLCADTAEELRDALDEQAQRWIRFTNRPKPATRFS